MLVHRLVYPFPFFQVADGGGSGGGGDTSVTTDTGGSSGGSDGASGSEPTPLDISDDALIRVKGSDKPVKFGDHVRSFQSQWTKAAQEAARYKKELAARDARLKELEASRAQSQPGQGQPDVFAELEKLPYLDGKTAAQTIRGIGEQIKMRDQVLLAALKQLQQTKQIVQELHGNHTNQSFDAKINKWITDGGYPAEAVDFAKELYLAYEGDDLDEQFPEILKSRWEGLSKIFEATKAAKLAAARKQPFLPGKGGQTGPSRPFEVKADASSRDIADLMWESVRAGADT